MSSHKIPTQQENPKGLHARYYIQKMTGKYKQDFFGNNVPELEEVDPESEYFVMRLDDGGKDKKHVDACRAAVCHYAELIKDHLPELAQDLLSRYGTK